MPSIMVTGASAGIGRVTAERFLQAGWTVGLIARRKQPLDEIAQGYDRAVVLPCDVTQEDDVAQAFGALISKAGRLDVLFNNAGTFGPSGSIDEISLEAWQSVVDVNLTGMFLCARAAFGQMRVQDPQGGRIINNGSISAQTPRPGSICYATTKHAISGLTKTVSLDGRAYDIACGQIDIGNALTEMTQGISRGARQADGRTVAEDVMAAQDVAGAVWTMASLPLSSNIQSMTIMATKMPFIGRG
ncbi:MAG: NADP-dependent 3-hydroxy acid dehydrogenase YdfG [Paracoccaceae bacterium]|jgi:NADP-dependent 3-hydroxy acid dehydrogenase YdfG